MCAICYTRGRNSLRLMVHGSLLLKMFSSGFYGNKSSLTRRLAVEVSHVRDGVGNSHAQAESAAGISYGDYGPTSFPDPTISIHQKLDAIVFMFDEQKTETRSENRKLKEEIVGLRCEVAELKKKVEEPAQASQFQLLSRSRISHDLSVSEDHTTIAINCPILFFCFIYY